MGYFTESIIQLVWEKAKVVENYDSNKWRKDFAGAWIQRDQYGLQSGLGWEIDHLLPQCKGGSDDLDNLNPLHWRNNLSKGSNFPEFNTSISSSDNRNILLEQSWKVK